MSESIEEIASKKLEELGMTEVTLYSLKPFEYEGLEYAIKELKTRQEPIMYENTSENGDTNGKLKVKKEVPIMDAVRIALHEGHFISATYFLGKQKRDMNIATYEVRFEIEPHVFYRNRERRASNGALTPTYIKGTIYYHMNGEEHNLATFKLEKNGIKK